MPGQLEDISRRNFLINGAATIGSVALAGLPAFAGQDANPNKTSAGAKQGSPKGKVLHIIGYSHIDAAWLWPWRDGSNIALTTFRSALDRINETPGFRYIHSSSIHYE